MRDYVRRMVGTVTDRYLMIFDELDLDWSDSSLVVADDLTRYIF